MLINDPSLQLSNRDKKTLLQLARLTVECVSKNAALPDVNLETVSDLLQTPAATFVTLTKKGMLRGCIGCLEARMPLILDVVEHAAAAAVSDYRFPCVVPEEVEELHIEISILTAPMMLEYAGADDLKRKLTPGVDGVTIRYGSQRATFLPQVWEKLPDTDDFLGHLCLKMGSRREFWKTGQPEISIYRVFSFCEEN